MKYSDLTSIIRSEDGSFDPSGKLVGVKEFSAEEFAARDIEAIKNPPRAVAIAGDPPAAKEVENMAKEYEAFGVTYDAKNDQWYFNGEKVRFFRDVLTSNGEGLTSGKFKGAIRTLGSAEVFQKKLCKSRQAIVKETGANQGAARTGRSQA